MTLASRFTLMLKGLSLGAALVLLLVSTGPTLAVPTTHTKPMPRCHEDETLLLGYGDFEHGRWSDYMCVHPDDYISESIENGYRHPSVYVYVRGSVCEHRRFWNREVGIRPSVEETCH